MVSKRGKAWAAWKHRTGEEMGKTSNVLSGSFHVCTATYVDRMAVLRIGHCEGAKSWLSKFLQILADPSKM